MPEKNSSFPEPVLSILRRLEDKRTIGLSSISSSAFSYVTASIFLAGGRPVLVITPEGESGKVSEELEFFLEGWVCLYPSVDWYTPESTETSRARAAALAKIKDAAGTSPVLAVAPADAIYQRTISPDTLESRAVRLEPGMESDRDEILRLLMEGGYSVVSQVSEPGEFSVRGGILDVFPANTSLPLRVEFFGDTIESLRHFDPETQRSLDTCAGVKAYPFHEVIFRCNDAAEIERRIMDLARGLGEESTGLVEKASSAPALREIVGQVSRCEHFPGIEHFIPYFESEPCSLLDHIGPDWLVIALDPLSADEQIARRTAAWSRAWEELVQEGSLLPPPEDLVADSERFNSKLLSMQCLVFGEQVHERGQSEAMDEQGDIFSTSRLTLELPRWDIKEVKALPSRANIELRAMPGAAEPLSRLLSQIRGWMAEGVAVVMASASHEKAGRLQSLLEEHDLHFPVLEDRGILFKQGSGNAIVVGEIDRGFFFPAAGLALISEAEIFGEKIRPRVRRSFSETFFSDLGDLGEGDYIVHVDSGIGIYRGMIDLKVQVIGHWDVMKLRQRPRISSHCLEIEYAGGDKLYLPVHRLNLIQKYRGAEGAKPGLDRLGSGSWDRSKSRVRRSLEEMAGELVKTFAARKVYEGHSFPPPDSTFREFETAFPYEETPDQMLAIDDVMADMERNRPMDRLVCGDVGYGKTEVALRASFKAAMDGKQVAVLVPTTILAAQHYNTFSHRLEPYPLEVRMLSRFQTPAEQKVIVSEISAGTVDIVVGTHRLLSSDVEFRDLGLLVIDEEQRFGVKHKEKLKRFRATVDILTLTATPIPRTLHLSLLGLRDLSVIDTPPPDRQAVHTELARLNDHLIREAVTRELARGGQVFFVHNRVQGIESVAGYLKKLLPDVRIAVAHGQMPERRLEKVMRDFVAKKYDLLVSTAIIESGLDIPSVNTMIVNRADQFGLAQLYQLRGRIGRSREKGYAYLLVPGKGLLTSEAAKRLKALKEFTELGSGFKVAAYDLEIRGAGNMLGREQSGHINRVGFELYARMLEEEVKRLKGEEVEPEIEPEMNLQVQAFIPDDYIPDQGQRLVFYRRLSRVPGQEELNELEEEIVDRYGSRPEEVENLFKVVGVKALLKKLRAKGIEYTGKEIVVDLGLEARVEPEKIINMVKSSPERFRISPDHKLYMSHAYEDNQTLFMQADILLNELMK